MGYKSKTTAHELQEVVSYVKAHPHRARSPQCLSKAAQESTLNKSCPGYLKIIPIVNFHHINFPEGFSLILPNADTADKPGLPESYN